MYKIIRSLLCLALTLVFVLPLGAQQRKRIVEHLVRSSETVYSIAQRYDTSTDKVYELNSWARSGIKPGDKLLIYTGSNYQAGTTAESKPKSEVASQAPKVETTAKPTKDEPQKPTKATPGQHVVEAGETLYRVALINGITVDELIAANPGISVSNFPIGYTLRIPKSSKQSSGDTTSRERVGTHLSTSDSLSQKPTTPAVRALVMLPISKAKRYLEFYQGFLMGLYELKKDGINISVTALDVDDEDVVTQVNIGAVQGYDFVIGGVNEEQCRLIAGATRMGYYIVPFLDVQTVNSSRLVQINQSPSTVMARVIPEFVRKYAGKSVIFARRNEDADDAFAMGLKRALREAGIAYQSINISTTSLAMTGGNSVVVPSSPDKNLAKAIMTALGNNQATPVFGHPQWQSYGDEFIRMAHKHNTTIFSTFYFDKYTSESKDFLTKFNAWYNSKVTDSYPKYSVLGYDIARYFIRGHAAYGREFINMTESLPSDGLQMDIELERSSEHEGFTNKCFYFVTYEQDGTVSRQTVK